MKLRLTITLTLIAAFTSCAVFAQTTTPAATGWGQTTGSSSGAAAPGTLKKAPFSTSPSTLGASSLNSSASPYGSSYGYPSSRNGMLSHNRRIQHHLAHTDANNPLLHPQTMSGSGRMRSPSMTSSLTSPATLSSPATMTPALGATK